MIMSTALDVEFKMCAIHKVNTLMRNTVFPSNANISVSSITLFHSRDNAHCTLHNTMQCNAMQCNSQCPSSNWKQFWFHCWNTQRISIFSVACTAVGVFTILQLPVIPSNDANSVSSSINCSQNVQCSECWLNCCWCFDNCAISKRSPKYQQY